MVKKLKTIPIKLFTIGFTKKNAETFFALLEKNKIRVVIDIRRNNSSQLAIFSKFPDLSYFLENLSNIKYKHFINLAPPSDLLKKYRNKSITWEQFEKKYIKIKIQRFKLFKTSSKVHGWYYFKNWNRKNTF